MNRKFLSILMTLMLTLSMLAVPVFAEPVNDENTDPGNTNVTQQEEPNETASNENTSASDDNSTNGGGQSDIQSGDQNQGSDQDNNDLGNGSDNDSNAADNTEDNPDDNGEEQKEPQQVTITLAIDGKTAVDGVYTLDFNRGSEAAYKINATDIPEDAEIEYTSSDESIVAVTNEGTLTVKGATESDPVVITASLAGNEDYAPAESEISIITEEWIPSMNEPASKDVTEKEDAVLYRMSGGDLMILERQVGADGSIDFTDEDIDAITAGKMDIWHGYKYKKAGQEITTKAESDSRYSGEVLKIKFGSKDFNLAADGYGDISYEADETASSSIDTSKLSSGIVSGIDVVGSIVRITVTAAGDEYHLAQTRTIEVEVVKGDQTITVPKTSYSVQFGTKNFKLGAKTNAEENTLKYISSNPAAVDVDSTGNVTIKNVTGSKVAVITISASETDRYNAAANKTVSITVTSPKAPTLTAKAIGGRKVQLNWSSVTGAVRYQIQPYLGKKALKSNAFTSTSIKNTKLRKGKTYKYKVRAVVTANGRTIYSPWSSVRSVKVK